MRFRLLALGGALIHLLHLLTDGIRSHEGGQQWLLRSVGCTRKAEAVEGRREIWGFRQEWAGGVWSGGRRRCPRAAAEHLPFVSAAGRCCCPGTAPTVRPGWWRKTIDKVKMYFIKMKCITRQ